MEEKSRFAFPALSFAMSAPRSPGSERAPLLWLILPLIGGIAFAGGQPAGWSPAPWYALLAAGLVIALTTWRTGRTWWSIGVILTGFSGGILHHHHHRQKLPVWAQLPDREVEVTVSVDRVFESAYAQRSFSFGGEVLAVAAPNTELIGQQVQVQLRRAGADDAGLARGATLRMVGQLTALAETESSGFAQYLEETGYNFRIRQARWIETTRPPSVYARARDRLRAEAGRILARGLDDHPDLVGALQAMLLGARHELSADAKSLFLRSGTMHLFAISGLHIGVIAGAIHVILRVCRVPRLTAFLLGCTLLLGYVDLIGQTPSAVRAWLMITCFHGSRVCRAPGNPVAAIATSALLVLLLNPLQLFSAGFQMSYAIVFALLLHGIPLSEHWLALIRPWRDLPRATLSRGQRLIQAGTEKVLTAGALTWSASLIGIISSVGFFSWFTPLAFYANLLLVPLAGLVIAGGFASIVLGLAGLGPVALVFNHAAALVVHLMQLALDWGLGGAASLPAEFITSYWGPGGTSLILVTMIVVRERSAPGSRWRWWGPPLATLLVLVIGLRLA